MKPEENPFSKAYKPKPLTREHYECGYHNHCFHGKLEWHCEICAVPPTMDQVGRLIVAAAAGRLDASHTNFGHWSFCYPGSPYLRLVICADTGLAYTQKVDRESFLAKDTRWVTPFVVEGWADYGLPDPEDGESHEL